VKGDGLEDLRQAILTRLPRGRPYFPEDYVTDQPERYLAAELNPRKGPARHPKGSAHRGGRDGRGGKRRLPSPGLRHHSRGARGPEGPCHRNGGAMLKKIGTLARQEMERLFG